MPGLCAGAIDVWGCCAEAIFTASGSPKPRMLRSALFRGVTSHWIDDLSADSSWGRQTMLVWLERRKLCVCWTVVVVVVVSFGKCVVFVAGILALRRRDIGVGMLAVPGGVTASDVRCRAVRCTVACCADISSSVLCCAWWSERGCVVHCASAAGLTVSLAGVNPVLSLLGSAPAGRTLGTRADVVALASIASASRLYCDLLRAAARHSVACCSVWHRVRARQVAGERTAIETCALVAAPAAMCKALSLAIRWTAFSCSWCRPAPSTI
eukprot:6480493-Amphidinium_carterae.1